ncbi:phage portal protein [Psychromarinibacter halotolerans]|uniref:Phage portal protein n=1 Tax=Psychromarinibacter halotolerans TaxID=1775175 RepID=A0ABV7GY77_9RHOB|nr:phage portal protein [Psychromarinibacter halotolerans]MDF0598980.1 phage portal protein [Psychromarinibacter halotolerans]
MGILKLFGGDRLSAAEDAQRDAADHRFFEDHGGATSEIDVHVSVSRARKVPVVRNCLSLLAGSVAGLENGVFRRVGEDRVERRVDHPVAKLLRNPNPRQTGFDFIYQMVDDLCAEGDFYAEKVFEGGEVVALWRMEPHRVVVEELADLRERRYRFRDRWGRERILLADEVWHIALPPLMDDLKGTSPILVDGREAVAVAIALQRYANTLFKNDATPAYAFSMEGHFADAESKENWTRSMLRRLTGRRRHQPMALEYGMKPHRLGLTAEEAQFLETRKELWLDLARLWRVPPHKVGILDRATFSNIEHQSLEFVTDTLRPILELIERSVGKFLLDLPDEYFEFNVESLLRGDIKARYEAYSIARQWGWMSVNDVLRMEHRNGIGPAGDRYMEPLNMVPVGAGAEERKPEQREAIDKSIAFLRGSVGGKKGKPRLELVKNAA